VVSWRVLDGDACRGSFVVFIVSIFIRIVCVAAR
jgi:hypothetical protein